MTFLKAKRWELEALMKTDIDDKGFISDVDIQKYTSDQMVTAIVIYDGCWGSSPNPDKIIQVFQDIIRKGARKLLAMCVYA